MVSDLPDFTRYITQTPDVPDSQQGPVIPRPKGGKKEKGSVTTTATYQTLCSYTPTRAKTFQLSKIVVSCEKAAWVKYRWDGADISCERLVDDKSILFEHFPWDYHSMVGDGSKAFDIQVKLYSEAGTANGEIVGEDA